MHKLKQFYNKHETKISWLFTWLFFAFIMYSVIAIEALCVMAGIGWLFDIVPRPTFWNIFMMLNSIIGFYYAIVILDAVAKALYKVCKEDV